MLIRTGLRAAYLRAARLLLVNGFSLLGTRRSAHGRAYDPPLRYCINSLSIATRVSTSYHLCPSPLLCSAEGYRGLRYQLHSVSAPKDGDFKARCLVKQEPILSRTTSGLQFPTSSNRELLLTSKVFSPLSDGFVQQSHDHFVA